MSRKNEGGQSYVHRNRGKGQFPSGAIIEAPFIQQLEGLRLKMTSAIGRLVLLGLVWLSAAVAEISSSRLRKCCPAGEIFSGQSKVDCVPTPPRAIELHSLHYDDYLVHENGFPVCEVVDEVTTTPLFKIASTDLLQVQSRSAISPLNPLPVVNSPASAKSNAQSKRGLVVFLVTFRADTSH